MSNVRTKRCRDCAYHPASPENVPYGGPIAAEGGSVVDFLEMRIREVGAAQPFHCHENLPCDDIDGWRAAKPGADVDDAALEVCAGWAAAYRRITGGVFVG